MNQMKKQTSNREVKSSAFTTYFSKPENAAKLYVALSGGEAVSPDSIVFTTLQGVLFMVRKNDMAFTVNNRVLVISEHQSTPNANMPLRDAIYYGRTMEKLINPRALYRNSLIKIPTPEFFVFYNGNRPFPKEKIMKLSDAYLEKAPQPMLELIVKAININLPANHPILEECRPLFEYSWFIQRIKEHLRSENSRDKAVIQAMADCRREKILEDFLREHGTEVINMLFTEFNMEDALDVRYEEGVEEGVQKGKVIGKKEGIQEGLTLGMERAKKILELLRQGRSVQEIAAKLEIPEEEVRHMLD